VAQPPSSASHGFGTRSRGALAACACDEKLEQRLAEAGGVWRPHPLMTAPGVPAEGATPPTRTYDQIPPIAAPVPASASPGTSGADEEGFACAMTS
jgi:hypothetical protein